MELFTVDEIRQISLPIYFESNEKFSSNKQHSMFRLIFVEEGTGILKLNENKIIFIAPAIFCLNEFDSVECEQTCQLKARTIYFNPCVVNNILSVENLRNDSFNLSESEYRDYVLIEPFVTHTDDRTGQFNISISMAKRISELFNYLHKELATLSNNFWRCRSRSYLLEILFCLQKICTDNEQEKQFGILSESDVINQIILYLYTNYQNKITIKQLTETFHINRTTLSAEFQITKGTTIIEYLIRIRIRMASIMLIETELPISEIMYRVGFNDITHFGRTFKKHTGYSPSEYRNK